MLSWNKNQIKLHEAVGKKLALVKDEVKDFLSSTLRAKGRMNESDVIKFVKNAYKKHGLVNDHKKEFCIVAFGKNTNQVHYFPSSPAKSLKLKPNSLILLDIWARINKKNSPYADMTWMFYYGKNPSKEIKKVWKVLVNARDIAIGFIKKEVKKNKLPARLNSRSGGPRGLDIDRVAHDVIGKAGHGHGIKHTIGHSLGFKHPHGDLPGINWREYSPLLKNVGYTIEPGIYLKNFGMRTEIDFYISKNNKVILTTPVQKEIDMIF